MGHDDRNFRQELKVGQPKPREVRDGVLLERWVRSEGEGDVYNFAGQTVSV